MGTSPCRARLSTIATPSSAPPTAPANTSVTGRILSPPLLRGQGCSGADDIAGALPVGRALRQLAPGAGGEDQRFSHVAHIVPKLGGGEIGHGFVLERAVGLGRLVPGEGVTVLCQQRRLEVLQSRRRQRRIVGGELGGGQCQAQLRRLGTQV